MVRGRSGTERGSDMYTLRVYSSRCSTLFSEMTSWSSSWKFDVNSQIGLSQSIRILRYLLEEHQCLIEVTHFQETCARNLYQIKLAPMDVVKIVQFDWSAVCLKVSGRGLKTGSRGKISIKIHICQNPRSYKFLVQVSWACVTPIRLFWRGSSNKNKHKNKNNMMSSDIMRSIPDRTSTNVPYACRSGNSRTLLHRRQQTLCVFTHQAAALVCAKWCHGRHIESVTSCWKLTPSVDAYSFTWGTILPNFTQIRFETAVPYK